ncbi:hypothetical protein HDU96_000410 [Phlyctochytrium bullatum]|nr:hypothetical protein HDU96_000410 [Phlyctochytrium bullatum]
MNIAGDMVFTMRHDEPSLGRPHPSYIRGFPGIGDFKVVGKVRLATVLPRTATRLRVTFTGRTDVRFMLGDDGYRRIRRAGDFLSKTVTLDLSAVSEAGNGITAPAAVRIGGKNKPVEIDLEIPVKAAEFEAHLSAAYGRWGGPAMLEDSLVADVEGVGAGNDDDEEALVPGSGAAGTTTQLRWRIGEPVAEAWYTLQAVMSLKTVGDNTEDMASVAFPMNDDDAMFILEPDVAQALFASPPAPGLAPPAVPRWPPKSVVIAEKLIVEVAVWGGDAAVPAPKGFPAHPTPAPAAAGPSAAAPFELSSVVVELVQTATWAVFGDLAAMNGTFPVVEDDAGKKRRVMFRGSKHVVKEATAKVVYRLSKTAMTKKALYAHGITHEIPLAVPNTPEILPTSRNRLLGATHVLRVTITVARKQNALRSFFSPKSKPPVAAVPAPPDAKVAPGVSEWDGDAPVVVEFPIAVAPAGWAFLCAAAGEAQRLWAAAAAAAGRQEGTEEMLPVYEGVER